MKNATSIFSSYHLGATLYMPITHPKVGALLAGEIPAPSRSIVLCLEDALAESDVERGIAILRRSLSEIKTSRKGNIFVRPRSLEMAHRLAGLHHIEKIGGFVAPKIHIGNAADWMDLVSTAGLKIMPTMETAEFFDPARVSALRDIFSDYSDGSIAAIRIGGNDLLGAMGLRREKGITSWESPLGWVLSMAAAMFGASGFPTAAPVFDIIEDLETLEKEVTRDVAAGFVSKTAIHPAQVPIIEAAFRVSQSELSQAKAILEKNARAVFQIGGVMCEPATHHAWAQRILARAQVYGVDEMLCEKNTSQLRSAIG